MRKTIGVYYTHYECFGHTSRVAAFAGIYQEKFPQRNFFFIQGGCDQPAASLDRSGVVHSLSRPFNSRANFRYPAAADPFSSAIRAKECLDIVQQAKPGVFVTEFFPLGRGECRDELLPSLMALSSQKVPLFSIAGYPLLTARRGRSLDFILSLYQRIFILCPRIEMDYMSGLYPAGIGRRAYREFFKKNERKVVFTGYLVPEAPAIKPGEGKAGFVRKGVVRVAVVRGGGAYYPQIIAAAIKASDISGDGYEYIFVAGPSTTDGEWRMFQGLMAKKKVPNGRLVRWTDRYDQLIAESDVCICPAPYHTSLSLLRHAKRAVVIPFEGYGGALNFREQPARARLLSDHIRSEVLLFKQLSASGMAAALVRMLRKDMAGVKIPGAWFGGASAVRKAI